MHFVSFPKQDLDVVLHRVQISAYFCPQQGQDFKPSAAPLYPNMGQVPPGVSTAIPEDQKRWTRLLAFIICQQRVRAHGVMGNVIIKNRSALRTCVPSFLLFFISQVKEIKLGCFSETGFFIGIGCRSFSLFLAFFAT